MFKYKGTQYLRLKMRSTPTPEVIFVPHIIPNNFAFWSSAQLGLYKLHAIIIRVVSSHNYSRPSLFGGCWGVACASVSPHRGPVDPVAKFFGQFMGNKNHLGVGVNLNSCSTYSCVLSSDPGSDLSPNHTVKKAYVASFLGWSAGPYSNGVGVRGFGVWIPFINVSKWDTKMYLFVEGKLGQTLKTNVVGYCTRIKTVPHMGGSISPPAGPQNPTPCAFQWPNNPCYSTWPKKRYCYGGGHPWGVGFWFQHGFEPYNICTVRDKITYDDLRHNYLQYYPPPIF